ncbi:MAG: retropepsin-like aspartic protease [Niallia sp.]
MQISSDGQLLTTSLIITFRGRILEVNDIIIDTGSSHTVISPDILEEIGVVYEYGDNIYEAYGIGGSVPFYTKIMDEIQIDTFIVKDIEVDVGILPKDHKGLLGLDILLTYNFIIDMNKLELSPSKK